MVDVILSLMYLLNADTDRTSKEFISGLVECWRQLNL